jgi:hypothetical protein
VGEVHLGNAGGQIGTPGNTKAIGETDTVQNMNSPRAGPVIDVVGVRYALNSLLLETCLPTETPAHKLLTSVSGARLATASPARVNS